jgi:hypothetical protein
MIVHFSIGARDVDRSRAFYDAVLAPLGYKCIRTAKSLIGYGYGADSLSFWVALAQAKLRPVALTDGLVSSTNIRDPRCSGFIFRAWARGAMSPIRHVAGVYFADDPRPPGLDALARVVATTLVESGDYAAARRFYELLEAALMREG